MKVIPVQFNTNRNISFSHYGLEKSFDNVIKSRGYSPETYICRDDFKWKDFVKYIGEKYSTADKVNLVDHACSAGYESYTILLQLIETLGRRNSQKFLPIFARDIEKEVIESAKQGRLKLCREEQRWIDEHFKNVFNNNFNIEDIQNIQDRGVYGISENSHIATCRTNLKDNVIFEQSDIFNDKDLINKDNTILLFRNVWKYLGENKVTELAFFLANNMKPSSLLVIGRYDLLYGINLLLGIYGFKETPIKYVYEPPREPVNSTIEEFPLIKCDGRWLTPEQMRVCCIRLSPSQRRIYADLIRKVNPVC